MKARIIYLATLMMVMFAMSACSNEEGVAIDDDENFPEISEEFLERTITIIDLSDNVKESPILEYQDWMDKRMRSNYECFHSMDEVKNSPYSSCMNLLPDIDWEKQTLVIIYIHANSGLDDIQCDIYRKSDKFLIDCVAKISFIDLETSRGIAVILNKANLDKKGINFILRRE